MVCISAIVGDDDLFDHCTMPSFYLLNNCKRLYFYINDKFDFTPTRFVGVTFTIKKTVHAILSKFEGQICFTASTKLLCIAKVLLIWTNFHREQLKITFSAFLLINSTFFNRKTLCLHEIQL